MYNEYKSSSFISTLTVVPDFSVLGELANNVAVGAGLCLIITYSYLIPSAIVVNS